MTTLPPRSDVPEDETWNAASVYDSAQAWEAERQAIAGEVDLLQKFAGTLGEGPAALAQWLETAAEMQRRVSRLYFYAAMSQAVETTNQQAMAMTGQAGSLYSQIGAVSSFAEPEMLSIGEETVLKWVQDEPRLAAYEHFFVDLFRQQGHVRSAEVEEVLALASDPFQAISNTEEMLTGADLHFSPVPIDNGDSLEVAQGTIETILRADNREDRRCAWESYADGYLGMKNTLASNYSAVVKRDVFYARARRYESSLNAALFPTTLRRKSSTI